MCLVFLASLMQKAKVIHCYRRGLYLGRYYRSIRALSRMLTILWGKMLRVVMKGHNTAPRGLLLETLITTRRAALFVWFQATKGVRPNVQPPTLARAIGTQPAFCLIPQLPVYLVLWEYWRLMGTIQYSRA